jgi:hypothetical protein
MEEFEPSTEEEWRLLIELLALLLFPVPEKEK